MQKKWFKLSVLASLLIITIIYVFIFWVKPQIRFYHSYVPSIMRMQEMFKSFSACHSGCFPNSKQELIEEDFLRNDKRGYEVKVVYNGDVFWEWAPNYDDFTIAYGIKFEQIEEHNSQLIDRSTGQPVYFILGPTNLSWHNEQYMNVTLDIYRVMKEYRQEAN